MADKQVKDLWTQLQKLEYASLKDLITHGQHVVPIGNFQRPRARHQCGKFVRRAGNQILAADRNQERHSDPADLGAAQRLPRATQAGGKRPPVGSRLLGEAAKQSSGRIGHIG